LYTPLGPCAESAILVTFYLNSENLWTYFENLWVIALKIATYDSPKDGNYSNEKAEWYSFP
jgi:hypothetical protein